jgi:hypothetical protein
VWSHSREKIGSDCDVTGLRDLVCNLLGPIGKAEDFVDEENDRSFFLRFGIDDKCLDRTAVVLNCDPLRVTW